MSSGWIKIHRKIIDSPGYFCDEFCRNMAWVDLILLANHDAGFFRVRGIRVNVKRGQVGYGLDELARRWKWSRGKVERFMKELEKDKQIVRQKNNVTTLISIVNYDKYQSDGKAENKTNDKADGQQTDTNKNDKKDNNEKNVNTEPIGSPGGEPPLQTADPSKELKEAYKPIQKNTESIYRFIRDKKPDFIDPYIDFWNLFAAKNSLPQVTAVTEKRKKKFKKRIQEAAFNVIEILRKAQQSDFLITSGKWFCFDWIIENESNYLKVIEGNYDNGKEIKQPEQTPASAAKDGIYKAREKDKMSLNI